MKRSPDTHSTFFALATIGLVLSLLAGTATAAGPGVHGRVFALDESGQTTGTVPGAKIEFRSLSGAAQTPATAGPNGYYRIDLPPGRYTYKVTAAGFQDEDQGRGIVLELTDGYAVYNFSLTKGKNPEQRKPPELPTVEMGHLEGRVLEKTPAGELIGVPGARISLRRQGGQRGLVRVTSQRQARPGKPLGSYAVELQTGSFRASVAASGFTTLVDPQPIAIAAGQTTERDFVLAREAIEPPSDQGIRGTVRLGGPRPTAGSAPKIQVQIIPFGPGAPAGPPLVADAQGRYARSLAEGRYRVLAQADGYRPARSGPRDVFRGRYTIVNLTLVPIAPPEEAKPPVVVTPPVKVKPPMASPPLVFRGLVLEAVPGGVKTRPLPGALVLLRKEGESLFRAQRGVTDGQGEITLRVADPGTYTFVARLQGYTPEGAQVDISPGGTNTKTLVLKRIQQAEMPKVPPAIIPPVRPEFAEPQTVTGYVVYRSPLSSTGVYGVPEVDLLWRRTTGLIPVRREATSAARGAFSLTVPAGTYQVELSPPQGYEASPQQVAVRPGMSPVYLYVTRKEHVGPDSGTEPSGLVTLNVRVMERLDTSRERPVAGAMVGVVQNRQRVQAGEADGQGSLSFRLPPGGYLVRAVQRGYELGQDTVRLSREPVSKVIYLLRAREELAPGTRPGETRPEMRPGSGLELQILGVARGPGMTLQPVPLRGARIVILRGGRVADTGQSEADGRYSTRLAPDAYEIKVTHERFVPATEEVTVSGGLTRRRIVLRPVAIFGDRPDTPPPGIRPGVKPPSGTVRPPSGITKPPTGKDKPPPTSGMLDLQVLGLKPGRAGAKMSAAPLPGAHIVVLQNGRPAATGESDRSGRYRTKLPSGAYEIKVTHDQFVPGLERISLSGGQTVQRRVLLRPTSPSAEPPPTETPRPSAKPPATTPKIRPKIKIPLR